MDRARAFVELLIEHKPFQDELYTHTPRNLADVAGFASSKGYKITEAELRDALDAHPDHPVIQAVRNLGRA